MILGLNLKPPLNHSTQVRHGAEASEDPEVVPLAVAENGHEEESRIGCLIHDAGRLRVE